MELSTLTARYVSPSDRFPQALVVGGAPPTRWSDRSYVLGTTGVTPAVLQPIASPIAGPVALPPADTFGNIQVVVTDRRWRAPGQRVLAGCSLLLREFQRAGGTTPPLHGAFLLAVPHTDGPRALADDANFATVLAATHGPRLRLLGAINTRPDHLRLKRWNPHRGAYGAYETVFLGERFLFGERVDTDHDRLLIESAALLADAYRNAINLTVAVGHAHAAYWPMYETLEGAEATVWEEVLAPLLPALARLGHTQPVPTHETIDDLRRVLVRHGQKMLVGDGAAKAARTVHHEIAEAMRTTMTAARARHQAAGTTYYGDEVPLFRDLARTADPEARTRLYREGIDALVPAVEAHWLSRIAELNALAVRAGFPDYAEKVVQRRFGCSTQDYFEMAMRYLAQSRDAYARTLRGLRPATGVDTPRIQDMPYLLASLGGGGNPRLRRPLAELAAPGAPAVLIREDAMAIVMQIFADAGFDLTQPPWQGVLFDIAHRTDKLPAGPMATAVDSHDGHSFVFAHFGPEMTLRELMILLYETGHAIHYQAGAEAAEGWMLLMDHDEAPRQVSKTVVDVLTRLFHHPEFLTHYLRAYPQFSAEIIAASCRSAASEYQWRMRRWTLLALFEMLLYRQRLWAPDAAPMTHEAILATWHDWVREHLAVAPYTETPYGDWVGKGHFFSAAHSLYFAAYTMGLDLADAIAQMVIPKGRNGLRLYGAAIQPLLRLGGRATMEDLSAAIVELRQSTGTAR